jgi:hypothetical protein
MRAIVAEEFGGYQNLKVADIPRPAVSDGRVLVRMTAAGVTPLDHTILSGGHPRAKAPLVLGNEGAGVVEGGDEQFPDGSRVMFTGPYGVSENGAFSEWVAVKREHLCLIPQNIDDAAAGHRWLWGRYHRGQYWWRHPERFARGLGAGWQSHHARLRSEPENDHRCDQLDLEERQHQKLLAVLATRICLGKSMDDDCRAS